MTGRAIELLVEVQTNDDVGGHWELRTIRLDRTALKKIAEAVSDLQEDE